MKIVDFKIIRGQPDRFVIKEVFYSMNESYNKLNALYVGSNNKRNCFVDSVTGLLFESMEKK